MTPWISLLAVFVVAAPLHAAETAAPSEGVVRKIDAGAGKITLRHGPIENLDMPPMTMVFSIDPVMLQNLKAGDRVNFRAEQVGGAYTIVDLQTLP